MVAGVDGGDVFAPESAAGHGDVYAGRARVDDGAGVPCVVVVVLEHDRR